MSSFRTASYEPGRRDALFALMDRVWGSHMSEAEFEWWFERNPAGARLISLAEANGGVVGVAAMSPFRMLLEGEERTVAIPVHVATDPEYRRRGVFPALERANEEAAAAAGAPLTLTFPNAASHPIFTGPLGWRDLPGRRLWARVLRPAAVLRYLLGRPGRQGGLGPPDPAPRRLGGVVVEPLRRFGADVDELWRRAAAAYGNHVVRDAEYLTWRYLDSPRDYRCFGAYEEGRLAGFAVVGHTYRHGVSSGFLADLITPPGARRATLALLRRSLAEVRGGADALVALPPPGRAQRLAFLAAGFLPTDRRIRFIGKVLRPDGRLPTGRGSWHFTLGDFDFF